MPSVLVLIVDDRESFREIAASVVEATDGFSVAGTAATGEESVEVVRCIEPDLVLMDVNLPGIDGIEATRRLRALPRRPVVVLFSTDEESGFGAEAAECGAVTYITKSAFGPARLVEAWALAEGG